MILNGKINKHKNRFTYVTLYQRDGPSGICFLHSIKTKYNTIEKALRLCTKPCTISLLQRKNRVEGIHHKKPSACHTDIMIKL